MKHFLVLASVMAFGVCAFGQSSTEAGQPNNSGQTAGAPARRGAGGSTMTVDGCLSGTSGHYMLKDKTSGETYALTGATAKLDNHVGHEVQVTGSTSASGGANENSGMSSSSGQKTSGNAGMQSTLNVTSVKHVADSCSGGM